MSLTKITYSDKQQLNANANINVINKCQASDMNEIKSVVNTNVDLQGDLANLTTDTKTSIVGAINDVNTKQILTSTIGSNVVLSGTSDTNISLISVDSVGTKLTISDGKVLIGSGVSKILVSGNACFTVSANSTNPRFFKIKKNNTETIVARLGSPSNTNGFTLSVPPQLLSVTSGDLISCSIQGVNGDTLRSSATATYLTVEVVG